MKYFSSSWLFGIVSIFFLSLLLSNAEISNAAGIKDILQKAGVNAGEQSAPLPKIDSEHSTEKKANHLIFTFIEFLLVISGIIGVLLVTWGGFRYATSFGEKDTINSAKKIIIGAITGLVVVILSYAILSNVINFIEISE